MRLQRLDDLLDSWLGVKLQAANHPKTLLLLHLELVCWRRRRRLHGLGGPLPEDRRLAIPMHAVPVASWLPVTLDVAGVGGQDLDVLGEGVLVGFALYKNMLATKTVPALFVKRDSM